MCKSGIVVVSSKFVMGTFFRLASYCFLFNSEYLLIKILNRQEHVHSFNIAFTVLALLGAINHQKLKALFLFDSLSDYSTRAKVMEDDDFFHQISTKALGFALCLKNKLANIGFCAREILLADLALFSLTFLGCLMTNHLALLG